MKQMLAVLLLLAAAIGIYSATVEGNGGTGEKVRDGGSRINAVIQSIDP